MMGDVYCWWGNCVCVCMCVSMYLRVCNVGARDDPEIQFSWLLQNKCAMGHFVVVLCVMLLQASFGWCQRAAAAQIIQWRFALYETRGVVEHQQETYDHDDTHTNKHKGPVGRKDLQSALSHSVRTQPNTHPNIDTIDNVMWCLWWRESRCWHVVALLH